MTILFKQKTSIATSTHNKFATRKRTFLSGLWFFIHPLDFILSNKSVVYFCNFCHKFIEEKLRGNCAKNFGEE